MAEMSVRACAELLVVVSIKCRGFLCHPPPLYSCFNHLSSSSYPDHPDHLASSSLILLNPSYGEPRTAADRYTDTSTLYVRIIRIA